MEEPLRILIIGAHPDDADINAGRTAVRWRALAHVVNMVSLTDGGAGHPSMDGPELARRRRAEAGAAAKTIGATYEVLDHPDGSCPPARRRVHPSRHRSGSISPRKSEMGRLVLCAGLFLGLSAGNLRGEEPAPPTSPSKVVRLFNGKDLTGLSTWLKDTGRDDPRRVFRVTDGLLHITGDGFGYLATERAYRDYRLIVEYKWGERTDGGKSVRNSGILLHATGPDGGAGGTWMSSIECQLAQGCVGDMIVIRGKDAGGGAIPVQMTSDAVLGPDKRPRWKEGGEPRVFTKGQLWWSRHDPDYKELLDTRGKDDVESPLGEWTRVECRCDGGRVTVRVNDTTVNSCYDAFPAAGKILLQSEGFELFVRKFELHPLEK